jgi:hypothetical protein
MATKKPLSDTAKIHLRRAKANHDSTGSAPSGIVNELVRHGLATKTGQVFERVEWMRVTARWPIFYLTVAGVAFDTGPSKP